MLCHAKALRPASMNSGGTDWAEASASFSAPMSSSSPQLSGPQLSGILHTSAVGGPRAAGVRVGNVIIEGQGVTYPVQAAFTLRADAADSDREEVTDLLVGERGIVEQQGKQPPAEVRKLGERRAQRRAKFRLDDLLLEGRCLPLQRYLSLIGVRGVAVPACIPPRRPHAFALRGGGQPTGERRRLPDVSQLLHQQEPDGLADVVGVVPAQPV